jgi:hypothetical protein
VSNGESCQQFGGESQIDVGLVPDHRVYTHTGVRRKGDETGLAPLEELGICHSICILSMASSMLFNA